MSIDRRTVLKCSALASLVGVLPTGRNIAQATTAEKADYTLRIATSLVETRARRRQRNGGRH